MKTKAEMDLEVTRKEDEIEALVAQINTPKFTEFPVKITLTNEVLRSLADQGIIVTTKPKFIILTGIERRNTYKIKSPLSDTTYSVDVSCDDFFEEYETPINLDEIDKGVWFTYQDYLPMMRTELGFVDIQGVVFESLIINDTNSIIVLSKVNPDSFLEYLYTENSMNLHP